MLSFRLRVVLLAAAMVLQAIAGASATARAMAGGYEHCRQAAKDASTPSNTLPDGQDRQCASCCLCSGPPSASVFGCAAFPEAPQAFHVLGRAAVEAGGAFPRLTRAGFPRGPPGA